MCSHYKPVSHINQLHQAFGLGPLKDLGRPDMWPGYQGVFIRPHPHADVGDEAVPAREALTGQWGLIPHWSKDGKVKGTFNARSETIAEKPTFRDAWRKGQRCIIPALSVFEPDWRSGKAVPAEVSRADGEPMGIAGIWSTWRGPTGWVESYTMLTVNADDHAVFKLFSVCLCLIVRRDKYLQAHQKVDSVAQLFHVGLCLSRISFPVLVPEPVCGTAYGMILSVSEFSEFFFRQILREYQF